MSQVGQGTIGGNRITTGVLALVVGPSGAGKDTLMSAARAALTADPHIVFARRVITRPSHDASEIHDPMSQDAFERAEAAGEFLLSWRAHGLCYAIPGSAADALRASRTVIANVSRASITDAEKLVEHVAVLHVTAPVHMLAKRIAARGRESEDSVAARLARQAPLSAGRASIVEIVNDGSVEDAASRFIDALRLLFERSTGIGR